MESSGFCSVLLPFSMEKQGLLASSISVAETDKSKRHEVNKNSDPIIISNLKSPVELQGNLQILPNTSKLSCYNNLSLFFFFYHF